MPAGAVPIRRDYDWALTALSVLGAALSALLLLSDRPNAPAVTHPQVAHLSFSTAGVRRRPSGTLIWQDLRLGDPVFAQDSLFVAPGSAAGFTFDDGSELDLEESSLVVLDSPRAARQAVNLMRGEAAGSSRERPLVIGTAQGAVELASGSEAQVDLSGRGAQVAVLSGQAEVKLGAGTQRLGARQRASVEPGGVRVGVPFRVELAAPARKARLFFQDSPGHTFLRWIGAEEGLRIQISRDPGFRQVLMDAPAMGGEVDFAATEAGSYWWRLVDPQGAPASETRQFVWVRDQPPTLLCPAMNENVYGNPLGRIAMRWTPVAGVSRYRLEVGTTPDFSAPHVVQVVDDTGFAFPVPRAEGFYYWRVRSDEPERGTSPFTEAGRFHFLLKPLPAAPELLRPEIEVSPATTP